MILRARDMDSPAVEVAGSCELGIERLSSSGTVSALYHRAISLPLSFCFCIFIETESLIVAVALKS